MCCKLLPPRGLVCRRAPSEGLGSPVAPEDAAACIGRPNSRAVPADGPARYPCPQLFQRARPEAPEPPAVLEVEAAHIGWLGVPDTRQALLVIPGLSFAPVEVAAHHGLPGAELVPREGPTRRSYPQPTAERTTVEEVGQPPSRHSIVGRWPATWPRPHLIQGALRWSCPQRLCRLIISSRRRSSLGLHFRHRRRHLN